MSDFTQTISLYKKPYMPFSGYKKGGRKMKKLLTILIVVALFAVTFVGCAPKAETPEQPSGQAEPQQGTEAAPEETFDISSLRLTFVTPYGAHPYWMKAEDGVLAAAKDLGVDVDMTGPTELNLDEQLRAIETAIASRVDGILTNGYVPEAFNPIFERAHEAGIPVVLIDADSPESTRICYIGTSNYEAGFTAGKAMIELTGGSAKIGILTGPLDSVNLNERIDGFKDAIKDQPNMEILATEVTDADLLKATEKAQTMLQAYPEMNAIFGVSGNDIVGAGTIVEEKGLVGQITLIGFDDLDQTLDFIRKGVVTATTVQRPYEMGYRGIEMLVEINKGNMPKEEIIDTGVVIVTAENVDSY